jgi:hypothetical protein
MGYLDSVLNKFWQALVEKPGSSRWSLDTPPGVADNGGLVAASGDGPSVAFGFVASNLLGFSPLAFTDGASKAWTAGVLPTTLTPLPGALSGGPGTGYLALLGSDGTTVVASTTGMSQWTTVATRSSIASSAAGRACGLSALTAVAVAAGGEQLVGGLCSHPGKVGLFERSGRSWVAAAPPLAGGGSNATTSVAAITVLRRGIEVVLTSSGGELIGMAETDAAAWRQAGAIALGAGEHVEEISASPERGTVVLVASGTMAAPLSERIVALSGAHWRAEGGVPRGAQAVAFMGSKAAAFLVHDSALTIEAESPRGSWAIAQHMVVPILYGSSS